MSDSRGERIRSERTRLGLSQSVFGAACGVTKRTQINYEQGENSPTAEYLALCADLGVDVTYVLTGVRSNASTSTHLPGIALVASSPEELARATLLVDTFVRLPDEMQPVAQAHTDALLKQAIDSGRAKQIRRRARAVDASNHSTSSDLPSPPTTVTHHTVTASAPGSVAIGRVNRSRVGIGKAGRGKGDKP